MMQFLSSYQQQITLTNAFCEKLKQLDLLEYMTVTFQLPNAEKAHPNDGMKKPRRSFASTGDD
jgi:hypothetical protein